MPEQATTTGTATSRARQARRAIRRATKARLALSGPSGAGKTWTALSLARIIAPGRPVVVIDTEPGDGSQGAAELYADHFTFDTVQWDPPYDPRDLTLTIKELGREYRDGVCIIDSASHFWKGQGGTLDIAGGRFGGWRTADPVQNDLVDAILRAPMHMICCTRAKQSYEVEEDAQGKQNVRKLGLAPIQRDDLEYEFQVVAMIDVDHRIDIGKTRSAPLAGLSFPANDQDRLGTIYGEWLAGGAELPRQAELDAIVAVMKTLSQATLNEARTHLRETFGSSASMTVEQMPTVWASLAGFTGIDPHPYVESSETGMCTVCKLPALCGWHDPDAPTPDPVPDPAAATEPAAQDGSAPVGPIAPSEPHTAAEGSDPAPDGTAPVEAPPAEGFDEARDAAHDDPEPPVDPDENVVDGTLDGDGIGPLTGVDDPEPEPPVDLVAYRAELLEWAKGLDGKREVVAELSERSLSTTGSLEVLRTRLVNYMVEQAELAAPSPALAVGEEPF